MTKVISALRTAVPRGVSRLDLLIVVTAGILYSVGWPTLFATHHVSPALAPFVAAAGVFPLLLIRHNPALAWAISAAAALVIPVLFARVGDYGFPWQVTHLLVMLALFAAVILRAAPSVAAAVWVGMAVLFLSDVPNNNGIGWVFGISTLGVVAVLVRWLVLSRRELARQAEKSDVERARRAVLEERTKIARDLHDVVAHHMSMVVVQAQTAAYRVTDVSPAAQQEFDAIAVSAREALNEVRVMLGVLRSDGQLADELPAPDAGDITALFSATERAGVPVTWSVTGDVGAVGSTVGLSLYRILQESLTNASRHAAGAPVEVAIDVDDHQVSLHVRNRVAHGAVTGTGLGLMGMRERAESVGGALSASTTNGYFDVIAALPVRVGATLTAS